MSGFAIADYVIFCGSLLLSLLIGVYHAYVDRNGTAQDYLLAGGNQGVLPVALSITATCISAITCLGFPTEVFKRGLTIWGFALGSIFGVLGAAFLTVPVFYPLHFTSIYEYLEKRFQSKAVRRIAVFSFIIKTLLYMGVCLYGPAAALNSVTPLSTPASILICGGICTVYTAIGGMKSVLWTDVFQSVLIFAGQISVLAFGASNAGGFYNVLQINKIAGRLTFPSSFWSPDPTIRHSIWSTLVGASFMWMMLMSSTQSVTQRIMCLSTKKRAMTTVAIAAPLYFIIMSVAMLCGLILTATYVLCDPMREKTITNPNQYLPYLVAETFAGMPGLTGLFVAAVFSSSLSSISSGINAIAAVLWEDVLSEFPFFQRRKDPTFVMKILSFFTGALSIAIAFLVMSCGGNVFTLGIKLQSCIAGALYALFFTAYFIKYITPKGVVAGWFTAFTLCTWVVIGSTVHPTYSELPTFNDTAYCQARRNASLTFSNHSNPLSPDIDSSTSPASSTLFSRKHDDHDIQEFVKKYSEEMSNWKNASSEKSLAQEKDYEGLEIYKLSYLFVNPFGAISFVIVASIVSLFDGGREFAKKVDKRMMFSFDKIYSGKDGRLSVPTESPDMEMDNNNQETKLNAIYPSG